MKIEDELKNHGCEMEPGFFCERLVGLWEESYPDVTYDQFQCNWRREREFCMLARRRLGLRGPGATADEFVLKTLQNQRKAGKLSLKNRRED
jgi:hypothetical protein